jgi:hypothetical protein
MTPGGVFRELRAIPLPAMSGEARWRLRRGWWRMRNGAAPQVCSYSPVVPGALHRLFATPASVLAESADASPASWCAHFMRHEFNLLGSGWKQVAIDRDARALGAQLNPGNAGHAAELFGRLDPGYMPIDWQLDFKSGFRWSEIVWHRAVRFGDSPGVDVKVPWELARMQHLPQLALAAGTASAPAALAAREFRNQVLDFVAANPPGWGVNWCNAMEVAIRVANWLIARDLFLAAGCSFDAEFDAVLRAATVDHGRHVAANLEWHPRYRGNHYLANIAGLVYCGAYLDGDEADDWLAFGIGQLESEAARQFNPDGGSFEASTCYHRLSGEIVAYATAAALALSPERLERLERLPGREICAQHGLRARRLHSAATPFGAAHFDNLRRIAQFTLAATKPGGRVVQIGDNDSGRFAKLVWPWRGGEEDHLDHRHLAAAIDGLRGGRGVVESPARAIGMGWNEALRAIGPAKGAHARTRLLARGPGLSRNIGCAAFPDFGLYVLRSDRIWLSVRCGEAGMEPLGAHAHNDQLAIELVLDGKGLVRDPGSFTYTPNPGLRDAYRSAAAHDVPRIAGREPASLGDGLFLLRGRTGARCLHFSARGFVGEHRGYGAPVWRVVSLTDDGLSIEDGSLAGPLDEGYAAPPFSPGYGLQED